MATLLQSYQHLATRRDPLGLALRGTVTIVVAAIAYAIILAVTVAVLAVVNAFPVFFSTLFFVISIGAAVLSDAFCLFCIGGQVVAFYKGKYNKKEELINDCCAVGVMVIIFSFVSFGFARLAAMAGEMF